MKKHLIFLLVAGLFAFSSCSSDDDATEENTVVGTWILVEMNPEVWDLEACPDKPVITFDDDGTADMTVYMEDNNCEAQSDEGSWSQDSENQYTINIQPFGALTGTVVFESKTSFVFSTTYQNVPFTFTFQK